MNLIEEFLDVDIDNCLDTLDPQQEVNWSITDRDIKERAALDILERFADEYEQRCCELDNEDRHAHMSAGQRMREHRHIMSDGGQP